MINLYEHYKKYPYEENEKLDLSSLISFKDQEIIYNKFEESLNAFSASVCDKYLTDFIINVDSKYFLDPYKQYSNVLFKTIVLSTLSQSGESYVLDCYSEELDFFDEDYNVTRFANIYALIAKDVTNFKVNDLGKKNLVITDINNTKTDNFLLRILNLNKKVFISKIEQKFNLKMKKDNKENVFILKENELLNEIIPYLQKKFNIIKIDKSFLNEYNNIQNKIFVDESFLSLEFDRCFLDLLGELSLSQEYIKVFKGFILNSCSNKVNKLLNAHLSLDALVKKLKLRYKSNKLLTNGLFGTYGLAVYNAMKSNNIDVITTEHGLTTGLSKWRKKTINYYEPRTSDYILTYNVAASNTYKKSCFKNLECIEVGAPDETKNIKNYFIQKLITKSKLNVKGHTVFYASLNLLTNNNGYFPYYSPDSIRYGIEKSIIKKILFKINKEVIYKYYPSQNYLYSINPYVKLVEGSSNVRLAAEEDFRYIRTAADIIVTSNPSSTLGWCIGLNKPLIYLDSRIYNPLENDDVRKAFEESFFVFNYDEDGWEERVCTFLNKPYSEIIGLWKEKEKYRLKYNEQYFLSNEKNAGKIGADFIGSLN